MKLQNSSSYGKREYGGHNRAPFFYMKPVSFIKKIENLKLSPLENSIILIFIIFLRNLLESQFEFPGYIGFVKIPIDSFLAFFLHFPLFYISIFYTLNYILSWLRGEKVTNILVIGFSIILIPPLFDHFVMGRAYHLSYFFEFESYTKGLLGAVIPWIKGIKEVSWGQRIEVYLGDLLVFGYLLLNNRGLVRAVLGFLITHFVIAGFGGLGLLLIPFMQKNWLLFSHHQIFIQVFALYLTFIVLFKNRRVFFVPTVNIREIIFQSIFTVSGILYCIKLNLPFNLPPFLFSSIIALIFLNIAILWGTREKNFFLILLGFILAISVRYEVFIFSVFLALTIYTKKIVKNSFLKAIFSGFVALSSLYLGTSVFFFYNTISLTPFILMLLVFIIGVVIEFNKSLYITILCLLAVILMAIFIPQRRPISEHLNLLNAIDLFRKGDYQKVSTILKDAAKNNITNFLLGAALVNTGDGRKGLYYLDKISEINRDITIAKLAGLNQTGRLKEGLENLDQGIKNGLLLDELYLQKARQLILVNEPIRAMACIDSAYLLGADAKECYNLLGDVYNQRGEYPKAIRIYKKVQEISPNDYYPYAQEGMAHYLSGDYKRAVELYTKALKLNKDDPVVHNNFGVVLRTIGDFRKARAEFLKALEIAPGFYEAGYNLSLVSLKEEKEEEAIYWLKKTLDINPDFTPARKILQGLHRVSP